MDKWIELVKAKMKELHITQVVLAERLGMSQGGVGHWLTKRRQPSVDDMNRVLRELGLEFLEVAMVIREPDTSTEEGMALAQKYNPSFRYPDRKSVVKGKSMSVRVDLGGSRNN